MMQCVKFLDYVCRRILMILLQFYKIFLSPALNFLGRTTGVSYGCKYPISCSEYSMIELKRSNVPKALFKIAKRLLSCSPFGSTREEKVN